MRFPWSAGEGIEARRWGSESSERKERHQSPLGVGMATGGCTGRVLGELEPLSGFGCNPAPTYAHMWARTCMYFLNMHLHGHTLPIWAGAAVCECMHMYVLAHAPCTSCIPECLHPLTCSHQSKKRLGVESSEGLALLLADDPILRAEEQGCQEAAQLGAMCVRSGGQGRLSHPVPGARLGQATCWAEESKPMLMGSSGTRAGLLRERLPANPAFHLVICPRKLQNAPELMVLSAD